MPKILETRTGKTTMTNLETNAGTVVGYTFNADVYCPDCAERYIENHRHGGMMAADANGELDEEMQELIRIDDPSMGDENLRAEEIPSPVFYDTEWDYQPHCANGKECLNATTEHHYRHDLPVGKPISVTVLHYTQEPYGDPSVQNTDDGMLIDVHSGDFTYTFEWIADIDRLEGVSMRNNATGEEAYAEPPEAIVEYAREIAVEGKQAGAEWA